MSTNGLVQATALLPAAIPAAGTVISDVVKAVGVAAKVVTSETVAISATHKVCVWAFRPVQQRYEDAPDTVVILYKEDEHFVRWEHADRPFAETVARLRAAAAERQDRSAKASRLAKVANARPLPQRPAVSASLVAAISKIDIGDGLKPVIEPVIEPVIAPVSEG